MKTTTSLLLAMVSTMFLTVGATRAAEKFDPLAKSAMTSGSTVDDQLPTLPTQIEEKHQS